MTFTRTVLVAALLSGTTFGATAETLRWARTGDTLTLDPHAQNEGPTHAFAHQVYEPLVMRDMTGAIVPALATEWGPRESDPNVWYFTLRQGVTFHDGATFDSEDVVFSLERAMSPDSDIKELLASVTEVRATGPFEIEIVTDGPNPIMPNNLTNTFILDKSWAEANDTAKVQDYASGEETFATRNTNGTGPYVLVSRDPGTKTVLRRNEDYWGIGEFPLEVTDIIYTPIQNAATRVAALLSGDVNFIQDVPVQDLDRVASAEGLKVIKAPQNRVIFFGMNQGDADLTSDNVEGANPFADVRVRKAMLMSLNRDAIQQVVMRGQSEPAGVIMPPFVAGWSKELNTVPATNIAMAKELMEQAGYGDGFSIRLDCPNDRYINDEGICQASVGMLAQIGINVTLDAKPKAQHFPLINTLTTDFYMLGWGVPTYDSEYIFNFLVHSKGENRGSWNATRYQNASLDEKIQGLASQTDLKARDATISEIWQTVQDDVLYLPIHHQVLNWGMGENVGTPVDPNDSPKFKWFTMN